MNGYNKNGVDDIMNSLQHMQPARPGASLYTKLEKRLAAGYTAARTIPLQRVSLAAACILLLILVNMLVLTQQQESAPEIQPHDAVQTLAEYYGLTDNMEVGL